MNGIGNDSSDTFLGYCRFCGAAMWRLTSGKLFIKDAPPDCRCELAPVGRREILEMLSEELVAYLHRCDNPPDSDPHVFSLWPEEARVLIELIEKEIGRMDDED